MNWFHNFKVRAFQFMKAKVDEASSFLIVESSSSMWQFAVVSCDSVGFGDDFSTWTDGSSTIWAMWQLMGDANLLSSKVVMCSSSMYFVVEPLTLWRERHFDDESHAAQIFFGFITTPTHHCRSRQLPLSNRFYDVRRWCQLKCRLLLATDCHSRNVAQAPRTFDCRTVSSHIDAWMFRKDSKPARWCCTGDLNRTSGSCSSYRRFRPAASLS